MSKRPPSPTTATPQQLLQRARSVLDGVDTPDFTGLIELIHAINPTGRGLPGAERDERYALKRQLQSLLIRHHGPQLVVQVDPNGARVVGLRHLRARLDACHAVVEDLDEDARSWVQYRIDTGEVEADRADLSPELPVSSGSAKQASASGPEEWLHRARELLDEYDFEAAKEALDFALEQSGGSVGTALPLLELLVETMGDYEGALALRPRIKSRGQGVAAVNSYLALAAAHCDQRELAARLLGDTSGPLASRAWTMLAEAAALQGDGEATLRAVQAARRCAPPTPELLAIESKLAALREQARAPLEAELQTLWQDGHFDAVERQAQALLARYSDSALARRLLKQLAEQRRDAKIAAALTAARTHCELKQWSAVLADLKSVAASDWTAEFEALNDKAREAIRADAVILAADGVVAQLQAGGLRNGLAQYLGLEDAESAQLVEACWPSPAFGWLREMRSSGKKPEELAAAALAMLQLAADEQRGLPVNLAELCQAHPPLRLLAHVNKLLEAQQIQQTSLRRAELAARMQRAQELADAEDWQGARDALDHADLRSGPWAAQRDLLMAAVNKGIAVQGAVDRYKGIEQQGNLIEAAHAAGVVAQLLAGRSRAAEWLERSIRLRKEGLADWRQFTAETPAKTHSALPLGMCLPEVPSLCSMNAQGQVLIGCAWHGVLFVEVIDPATAAVVRRSVVDTGQEQTNWRFSWFGEGFVAYSGAGECLVFDSAELALRRRFWFPKGDGEYLWSVEVPQGGVLWGKVGRPGRLDYYWYILDLATATQLGKVTGDCDLAQPVYGLDPPGVWVAGSMAGSGRFLTPRGRSHPIAGPPRAFAGLYAAAAPHDQGVAGVFGSFQSGHEHLHAVAVCQSSGQGSRQPARWPVKTVVEWHAAAPSIAAGRMLAIGEEEDGGYSVYIFEGTRSATAAIGRTPLCNQGGLSYSADGQHSCVLAPGIDGLVTFTDPEELGESGQELLVRPHLVEMLPGDPIGTSDASPLAEFLTHFHELDETTGPTLALQQWDGCSADDLRLLLFGRAQVANRDDILDALRPRLERLAMTTPSASFVLMREELDDERWPDAKRRWQGIQLELVPAESKDHYWHLGAYLAMMTGELNQARDRLRHCQADPTQGMTCQCPVDQWEIMINGACEVRDGLPQSPDTAVIHGMAQCDALLRVGRCADARFTLNDMNIAGEPATQYAARAAEAWLKDHAERSATERFAELLAMAVFLDSVDSPRASSMETMTYPGHHWPRKRLTELADRARLRFRQLLGRPGSVGAGPLM